MACSVCFAGRRSACFRLTQVTSLIGIWREYGAGLLGLSVCVCVCVVFDGEGTNPVARGRAAADLARVLCLRWREKIWWYSTGLRAVLKG